MSIALPLVLLVSWFAFVLMPAGEKAIEDEQRGVPEDKRQGTSIFPGFPIMPLAFWAIAWLLDRFVAPWGSRAMLILHLALLLFSVFIIVRDVVRLRKIIRTKA
jgi:hypothetical protein